MEKGETGEKVESQWTTFSSGPLAGPARLEKRRKWGKSGEPVVDSFEWTTSWARKHGKGRNRGKSREPVVHFAEWTTSSGGKLGKGRNW